MTIEEIQHLENQQKLLEQRTYQEFKAKEEEAREAYLTYYATFCQKLDINTLKQIEVSNKQQIEELNLTINDLLAINPVENYMTTVYQLHIQKKWSELNIIQQLIQQKNNEAINGIKQ